MDTHISEKMIVFNPLWLEWRTSLGSVLFIVISQMTTIQTKLLLLKLIWQALLFFFPTEEYSEWHYLLQIVRNLNIKLKWQECKYIKRKKDME